MKGRDYLCPSCNNFALELVEETLGMGKHYRCRVCGQTYLEEEFSPILNEDSMQRFPSSLDATPTSNLEGFMKGKKP